MTARHLIAGLVIYLASLVALAPATLLAALVEAFGNGRISFADIRGSLWSGRAASLSVARPNAAPVRLDDVSWTIAPHRWLVGEAPVRFENRAGDIVAAAGIRPVAGGIGLSGFRAEAGLETIAPYLKGGLAAGLTGRLQLRGDDLGLGSERTGKLDGEIRVGAGRLPPGTYNLTLQGEGRRFALRWRGPKGPREMSGGGWWDDRLHLDGVPGAVTR